MHVIIEIIDNHKIKILVYIFLIIALFTSCQNHGKDYFKEIEELIEINPDSSLKSLASIKRSIKLTTDQLVHYHFLKWHATFTRDGYLENFTSTPKIPEYWLRKNDEHKAAYAYLYNGILNDCSTTFKQAAIYYNKAQQLAIKQKDSLLIFYTYYYQGKLFLKNREFNNGETAFQKALQYLCSTTHSQTPHFRMKVAECYLYIHNYEAASQWYNRALLKMNSHRNSSITIKTLYQTSQNIHNKNIQKHIAEHLKNDFGHDVYAQVFYNLVNTELYLKKNQPDSAYQFFANIPINILSQAPYILLQYYRIEGQYYYQKKEYKKAVETLHKYIDTNDQLKTNLYHTQINKIIDEYSQANLQNEIHLLRANQLVLILAILTLLFLCLLCILSIHTVKREKEKRLFEAEKLVDTLQEVCDQQKQKQNEFKKLLFSKLNISHKLVCLSSQNIPKNTSFIKMYDEIMGDIHSTTLNWEEFYKLIDCLYDNFHKKLLSRFPMLNEKEIQTCCLLLGGFKNEEIAFVIKQTIFSVHKRKTTIRKKLNFEDRADIVQSIMEILNSTEA